MYNFFFSSRRRHTILVSDWSSDVCSSDLAGARSDTASAGERCAHDRSRGDAAAARLPLLPGRSRRTCRTQIGRACVGKECRYRWSEEKSKRKELREAKESNKRTNTMSQDT